MEQLAFHRNYGDRCDGQGFQFEFYCEHCGDAWRTEYQRYVAATASGLLDAAGSVFGGLFGTAGGLADRARDAGWRKAHDAAFGTAVQAAQEHFHRCRRCNQYVCAQCYNPQIQQCTGCAPAVEQEADVAARGKEIELAQAAAMSAVERGALHTDEHVACPGCGARVAKGKFCPECGQALATKTICRACGEELAPGAKFCAECGARQ